MAKLQPNHFFPASLTAFLFNSTAYSIFSGFWVAKKQFDYDSLRTYNLAALDIGHLNYQL